MLWDSLKHELRVSVLIHSVAFVLCWGSTAPKWPEKYTFEEGLFFFDLHGLKILLSSGFVLQKEAFVCHYVLPVTIISSLLHEFQRLQF